MIRLEELRTETGLNMMQTAAALNLPYTTYVSWEKGKREPNSEWLVVLADFFNCSIDYLVGRSNNRSEASKLSPERPISEILAENIKKESDSRKARLTKEAENMNSDELIEMLGVLHDQLKKRSHSSDD